MRIILLLFVCFLLISTVCNGQERPAMQVDSFGHTGCEALASRVDNFYIQLNNNPNSVGYAVIYGKPDSEERYSALEYIVRNVRFRGYDRSRLTIIKGEDRDRTQVEFWIVPPGADAPKFVESKWVHHHSIKRPTKYYDANEDSGLCANVSEPMFTDILNDNPNLRGKVVIAEPTKSAYLEKLQEIKESLGPAENLPITYVYLRSRTPKYQLWLLPTTAKRRSR